MKLIQQEKIKEDSFWNLFLKQNYGVKVIGLQTAFEVNKKVSEVICGNFQELFSADIIQKISQ